MARMRVFMVFVLAITAGGALAFGTYNYVQHLPAEDGSIPTTPVVVAASDLDIGAELSAKTSAIIDWPANAVPANAIGDPKDVIGRGLVLPVIQNEPILPMKLASKEAGAGLPPAIPPGLRAVSVRVNEVIGVAGYVLPGTRVDVLATVSPTGNGGVADLPTPVTFCEIFPPDDFPLYFYRRPEAPDLQIDRGRAATGRWSAAPGSSGSTGTGLSRGAEPLGDASPRCAARGRAPLTVLDLDYRPMFWPDRAGRDRAAASAALRARHRRGRQPRRVRHRGRRARPAAGPRRRCWSAGVELAVVKQGPQGVLGRDPRRAWSRCRRCRSRWSTGSAPATRSAARCATACSPAGPLEPTMRFANAAGAIVASRLACSDRHAHRPPRSRPRSPARRRP